MKIQYMLSNQTTSSHCILTLPCLGLKIKKNGFAELFPIPSSYCASFSPVTLDDEASARHLSLADLTITSADALAVAGHIDAVRKAVILRPRR
jgi:hypothetical protein